MTLAATSSFDRNRPPFLGLRRKNRPHCASCTFLRGIQRTASRSRGRVAATFLAFHHLSTSCLFSNVPHPSRPLSFFLRRRFPLSSRGENRRRSRRGASIRLSPCRPDSWDPASNPFPTPGDFSLWKRNAVAPRRGFISERKEPVDTKGSTLPISNTLAHTIVDVWNARGGRGVPREAIRERFEETRRIFTQQTGSTRRRSSRIWTIERDAAPRADFNRPRNSDSKCNRKCVGIWVNLGYLSREPFRTKSERRW